MNKVVTIDFDIIMSPSIFLYNDEVPGVHWDTLLNNPYKNEMRLLRMNATYYQKIFNFLIECSKILPADKIHFVEDHSQAVEFITEKSDVYNIDYHHDLGYPDNKGNLRLDDCPNCANWVYYLNQKELLNSYTWIKDDDRWENPIDKNTIEYEVYDFIEYDMTQLLPINDLVIVLSEPWVPPYYRDLYFTLMDYCNSYYYKHFDYLEGAYLINHPPQTEL